MSPTVTQFGAVRVLQKLDLSRGSHSTHRDSRDTGTGTHRPLALADHDSDLKIMIARVDSTMGRNETMGP